MFQRGKKDSMLNDQMRDQAQIAAWSAMGSGKLWSKLSLGEKWIDSWKDDKRLAKSMWSTRERTEMEEVRISEST